MQNSYLPILLILLTLSSAARRFSDKNAEAKLYMLDELASRAVQDVYWAASKRFESSKLKFKFPRARTYEMIGFVLGSIEAKFCE